jgi:hypothetical protein
MDVGRVEPARPWNAFDSRYPPHTRPDKGPVRCNIHQLSRADDFASAQALVLQSDGKLCSVARARYVAQQLAFTDFGTLEPIPATFHFTPEPTGYPESFGAPSALRPG